MPIQNEWILNEPIQINISIFIASFTTCCWARHRLHQNGLTKLKPQQTFHFDTDAIIYKLKPEQPKLSLEDSLGQFTNEIDAKNYGNKTKNEKAECQLRSIRLNTRDHQQLNFDILR